jgi:hypothetical protein
MQFDGATKLHRKSGFGLHQLRNRCSRNINARERVDSRSETSLTGDVTTQRINIGDGAFFRGGIDSKPGQ